MIALDPTMANKRNVASHVSKRRSLATKSKSPPKSATKAEPPQPEGSGGRRTGGYQGQPKLLTIKELAAQLAVSCSSAYRIARDLLPSYKIPGVGVRVSEADLLEFIEKYRQRPIAEVVYERRAEMRARATARTTRRRAGDDDDEIVFDGMTRRELKEKAGF